MRDFEVFRLRNWGLTAFGTLALAVATIVAGPGEVQAQETTERTIIGQRYVPTI